MRTKKIIAIALFIFTYAYAQIPNAGFETNNSCGLSSNWSYLPLTVIIIDSLGPHPDSVIYDGVDYYNYPVADVHSGNQAISIRNAYSYTYNEVYIGRADVFPDSAECSSFFANMLPINYNPVGFQFYYKYLPVNNDTASAIATLYDINGTEIAKATEFFIGTHSIYSQVNVPFNYSQTADATYYSIGFYNMITDGYPHQATLGTRLLVDDVSFTGNSSIGEQQTGVGLSLFPNPAIHSFAIKNTENIPVKNVALFDMHGSLIRVYTENEKTFDCSSLSPGLYQVKIETGEGSVVKKLLVTQ
jgi:hypothetical protein